MKKTSLLLIAVFGMTILSGCQNEQVKQAPVDNQTVNDFKEDQKQPVEESNIEYMYLDDEDIGFAQGDVVWLPVSIEEKTELKSNNQYAEDMKASDYSKYIIVTLGFVNVGTETQTRFTSDVMEIVDSQGRKYKPSIEATKSMYVEDPVSFMEFKPSIPAFGNVVYEVAKDSEGFYYTANYDGGEHRIMLKNRNE